MGSYKLNKNKIILDICGGTGAWSQPYREAGYDVRVIDLKYGDDAIIFQNIGRAYGVLAAPDCSRLAGCAAYLWTDENLRFSLALADACLRIAVLHNPEFWALENPVGRLRKYYGDPTLIFNPCDYGDPYTKKTLLWGMFNIPKRKRVKPVEGSKMHKLPPSKDRKTIRAITPPGFARAFFEANR